MLHLAHDRKFAHAVICLPQRPARIAKALGGGARFRIDSREIISPQQIHPGRIVRGAGDRFLKRPVAEQRVDFQRREHPAVDADGIDFAILQSGVAHAFAEGESLGSSAVLDEVVADDFHARLAAVQEDLQPGGLR